MPHDNEHDYQEYLADLREARREADIEHFNKPAGKWAPADFVYECPAARRGP